MLEGAVAAPKEVSFTQAPTQTGTQLDDLSASDFLPSQEEKNQDTNSDAVMLAAVEAAEAEYLLQSQVEKQVLSSTSTQSTPSKKQVQQVRSPVSTTKSGAAAVAPAALKRLTKLAKSNAMEDDDDDDLFFRDEPVRAVAPVSAATSAAASVTDSSKIADKAAPIAADEESINLATIKAGCEVNQALYLD